MRAVVMRVKEARVTIDGEIVAELASGLLVYLGVKKTDSPKDLEYLLDKVINLRIFKDAEGKMNLSLRESGGGIMVVSQFTLYGDARKGRRPSYSEAASPLKAAALYEEFIAGLKKSGFNVVSGRFQAMMEVFSINDGPVTILLDSEKVF